ncbi:hypothetical protein, partial [Aeromicrobium sp.]|uniref:hypothetical protein n=1 Tax=Aeromicrobium sp. TaxID=1871063 RepID=UPI003C5BBF83
MNDETDLAGTTVTLFGDRDQLEDALSLELARRGCSTHSVTTQTGWLRSATHAVLRLDTPSGAAALAQLAETDQPRSHVVAVCSEKSDQNHTRRIVDLCRACGVRHDVSLIWHLAPATKAVRDVRSSNPTDALAAAISDEVTIHLAPGRPASYTT